MATLQNAMPSRKRMATYGKAARRRIPEYPFTSLAHRSQTPEARQSEVLPSDSFGATSLPGPKISKSTLRTSVSRTASPGSPEVAADIFEVPSSSDGEEPNSQHISKTAKTQDRASRVAKETLTVKKEYFEMRKRVKLSPGRPVQKLASIHSITKASSPRAKVQPDDNGPQTTFWARSKPAQRKSAQPRTPRKLSPVQKSLLPSTASPPASRSIIMDVDPPGPYLSPRGVQMWKDLLEPAEGDVDAMESTDMTKVEVVSSPMLVPSKTLSKAAGVVRQSSPRRPPGHRLIDSLVEEASHDDDMVEDDSEAEQSDVVIAFAPPASSDLVSIGQSVAPEVPDLSIGQGHSQGSQYMGPKFTYSKQRSMLAEKDFLKQLEFDMPSQPVQSSFGKKPRRGSIPTLPKLQSFHEDEDGDNVVAIRSVHELRQAGANNRFMDEIEDLLDRVGSPTIPPSSMRRSGLLDIASKIKDKSFTRQFRSYAVEQRLFVQMGRETDIIAGTVMISILMALLAEANVMPHVVTQLRTQGIARLLIRLLESQTSIEILAKERKSNMSKIAQSLLSDHIKYLLGLAVWEEIRPKIQPKTISPRTVALKCLELMVRQTREAGNSGDLISKELTTKLFTILKSASVDSAWEMPIGKDAIDFALALSALESHSLAARTLSDENIWIVEYLPIIADTLEIALMQPMDKFGDLQYLIFRLTLNVTNNNEKASEIFARGSLMALMGQVIVSMFKQISRFLTEEEFSVAVENLVLLEGVMINFAEWSSAARDIIWSLQDTPQDSLDHMVMLLLDNQEQISLVSIQ